MAWVAISGYVPQATEGGNQAAGYVLKFYRAGTSTQIGVAIDNAGTTPTTGFLLDAEGYTTVSGARVIPHVDEAYRVVLYENAVDAVANIFANAIYDVDNIDQYEPNVGNPSTTGYVLSSTKLGVRSWVAQGGAAGAVPSQVDIETDLGAGTYTVPNGATALEITCIAAGGGGGASFDDQGGSGGGGGGISTTFLTSLAGSYSINIGSGGNGGASGAANDGVAGGDTSLTTVCVAKGGSKGLSGDTATNGGGAGGLASGGTGDVTFNGFDGQSTWSTMNEGGLGGGRLGQGKGGNGGDWTAVSGFEAGASGENGRIIIKVYT